MLTRWLTSASLITTAAGRFARRARSMVAPIAWRSAVAGWQGIRTRSAARAASRAASAVCAGVSITARSVPASAAAARICVSRRTCAEVTTGVSALRKSPHTDADPCGSRSTSSVASSCASPATARQHAIVVFPAPGGRRPGPALRRCAPRSAEVTRAEIEPRHGGLSAPVAQAAAPRARACGRRSRTSRPGASGGWVGTVIETGDVGGRDPAPHRIGVQAPARPPFPAGGRTGRRPTPPHRQTASN